MPSRAPLRLGTRDSLLARAQSRIVVHALRAADPGIHVELVTVDTRGDRDRATPLSEVEDPGFFSAELDEALVSGRVDFCVHSLKDLPLAARSGIRTAAIPPREDPRDVVIFRPGILGLLASGETIRIGSSSERRAELTRAFLAEALPETADRPPRLAFLPLRGPVEERLARIRVDRAKPESLDGVILALAGLARLWGDRDGHAAIAPALADTRIMVLPLTACPTAPGQGALAVECRSEDARVAALLRAIDDPPTARRVRRELALLASQPELRRGAFAATAIQHEPCGTLVFTGAGRVAWDEPPRPAQSRPWDGAEWVVASGWRPRQSVDIGSPPALFLAHWRALPSSATLPRSSRLWTSGIESWRKLARRGLWIEGCADNLGFDAVVPTLRSAVLRLPPLAEWTVLTRADALQSWTGSGVRRVIATYDVMPPDDGPALEAIRERVARATHFFWGSTAQYRALAPWLPPGAEHACGPGKTWRALRDAGIPNLRAFPSRREWRSWVG